MKLPKYAKLKRGVIHYQRRVPSDVRHVEPFLSMPAVHEKSLKTADLGEALREFADIHDWFERQLAAARAGTTVSGDPMPTPGEPRVKVLKRDERWAAFHAREEFDRIVGTTRLRMIHEGKDAEGAGDSLEDWLDYEIADLNSQLPDLQRRKFSVVRRAALRIFAKEGVVRLERPRTLKDHRAARKRLPIEDTVAFDLLSDALITARLEAYAAIQLEFAGGVERYEPKSEILRSAPTDLDEDEKYGLAGIAEQLLAASGGISKTWATRIRLMPEICEQFGFPADIRRVQRTHIAELMEKLLQCPANKTQRFPGLSWPQALEANKVAGKSTLSLYSVRDGYLAPLSRILSYAEQKGIIPKNPATKVKIEGTKRNEPRGTHFEVHELNAMLQLPQFVGCKSKDDVLEPGNVLLDDHWFWAPLISLFTGARTSEIAQLFVSEVIFAGTTPYFRIQTDDGRRVKTRAGIRTVPIHKTLLKIGFKEYVDRVKARSEKRLFPEWQKPEGGSYADSPSQRHFRRNLIPRISEQRSPPPNFHSFRNTIKSEMDEAGVPRQHQEAMVGHEQTGMGKIYATKKVTVGALGKSMAKVEYEGLEIAHLFGTRVEVKARSKSKAAAE